MKGTPTASNSRAYQPAATPRIEPPLADDVQLPRALAATAGLRSGSTSTPVPSLIVDVRAGDGVERADGVQDGEGGLDAEEHVIPRPQRLEAERLGPRGVA